MKLLVLFLIIFVRRSQSGWDLIWNEEFNQTTIDTNKWEIENELVSCHGQNYELLKLFNQKLLRIFELLIIIC